MKMKRFMVVAAGLMAMSLSLQSCLHDNDDYVDLRPTALVTVRPASDMTFTLQLDNETTLHPSNLTKSPYGAKEVRALVNYNEPVEVDGKLQVHVNWMDSIRTKKPVASLEDNSKFGNDPVEIVKDWVTVAEDGYLTLRVRTVWGRPNLKHELNLLTGTNPENPYELELRHNAFGDVWGEWGDSLIAFNLNDLPVTDSQTVTIKLKWNSFTGPKSQEFELYIRPKE